MNGMKTKIKNLDKLIKCNLAENEKKIINKVNVLSMNCCERQWGFDIRYVT